MLIRHVFRIPAPDDPDCQICELAVTLELSTHETGGMVPDAIQGLPGASFRVGMEVK